mmetsp:Transcript_13633/g.34247  ORF Transcript_13633/g.34247 Transcript_13633/m.34247 type:complete len:252 (+) Transcript_13633:163-918(+)
MAQAPLELAVTEFGAGALWAIAQAFALVIPGAFQVHDLWAGVALVVVVVVFQLLLYSPGAPNAAVQLGAYLSQESSSGKTGRAKKKAEEERIRFTTAARMVLATMAGAMVGSVFARDTLQWLAVPVDGMKPPISFFPQYGHNFVLGIETATSLIICALSLIVLPKRFNLGLAGLFIVPVPAALVSVPGIDPAWSFGRAFAAKHFDNNQLYLIGPFAGAVAFGAACKLGELFKKAKAAGAKRKTATTRKKKN